MSDFTYIPSRGFKATTNTKIYSAGYGDGYSQRLRSGFNNTPETYDLTFENNSLTDAAAILAFFESKYGTIMFTWTPPGSSEVKVICSEWAQEYASPISRTITAKFVQVFDI